MAAVAPAAKYPGARGGAMTTTTASVSAAPRSDAPIEDRLYDIVVVGGGINGVGIARDAAGRKLATLLLEKHDLAGATSSASSKLIHGGLRYLEQSEFRLVRESLKEREVLWAAAPHAVQPLRFVLPVRQGMRPAWMLRTGLFLYDHIGERKRLAPTRTLRRGRDSALDPLHESIRLAFEYSDCWVDDARMVVLNAIDAQERGAHISVGWALTQARREEHTWRVETEGPGGERVSVRARALVNAAGPWVEDVLGRTGTRSRSALRLIKGSHFVVPRLYPGPHAYTFQGADGRVIFTIPYERNFTLIGTTDVPYDADPAQVKISTDEIRYLCDVLAQYLRKSVSPEQAIWEYSGVRPLYDDGGFSASTVTRDYVFDLDAPADGAPVLSVFGGKLTTYRKLAEHALGELLPKLGIASSAWTRAAVLPGGDIPDMDIGKFTAEQQSRYAFAEPDMIHRMCRAYGTRIERVLGSARNRADLGTPFSAQFYEAELEYLQNAEWARCAQDVLWRRSKLGLTAAPSVIEAINRWFSQRSRSARPPRAPGAPHDANP
ncbi:MAG: glycerol-3-phosphate dehydrogenase [Steroidobacteraceae bacterium]